MYEMKYSDSPIYQTNIDKLNKLLHYKSHLPILLGFIDQCNHIHRKKGGGFQLDAYPGSVEFKTNKKYLPGDEFNYEYQGKMTNEKCLLNYGFLYKGNINSIAKINITINKIFFPKQKYDLAVKLNFITNEQEKEMFSLYYEKNSNEPIQLPLPLERNRISKKFVNYAKLIVFNPNINKMSFEELSNRIKEGQMIDYDTEVRSHSYLRSHLLFNLFNQEKIYLSPVII